MSKELAALKALIQESTEAPPPKLSDLIIVVYGDKKVGKSTFASRFDQPLFLDFEDALRSVRTPEGKAVPRLRVCSWQNVMDHTKVFETHSPEDLGVKTIIIDGVNEAFQYLRKHVLAAHGVQHENDGVLGYGKGKGIISTMMHQWFIRLRQLTHRGYGVVITAHSRPLAFEHAGVSFDKQVPMVSGDKSEYGWDLIKPSVDMIVYAKKQESKGGVRHVMHTKGTQLFEAADPTPGGKLPDGEPLSYYELAKAYEEAMA